MTKTNKTSGKRANAGRKAIPDAERKVQLSFYVKRKHAERAAAEINKILKAIDA